MKIDMHKFTFHYVSIKSSRENKAILKEYLFTFHYVSIKSGGRILSIRAS